MGSLVRLTAAAVVLTVTCVLAAAGQYSHRAAAAPPAAALAQTPGGAATEAEVQAQCGSCHLVPPPDVLPRGAWRDSVARMMLIRDGRPEPMGPIGTAARMVILPRDMQRIVRYYTDRAPERLPPPPPWPDPDPAGFIVHGFRPEPTAPRLPAISHVRLLDLDGDGSLDIVAADMRQGLIVTARATDPARRLRAVGRLQNPSHLQLSDFDGDGARDLLVADLGSFQPANHTDGSVVWMRNRGEQFEALRLPGWPRVADVEPGDFNGDGKTDLAVAAFGWRTVGRMAVLENRTTDYARPAFTEHVIDARSGGIHAVPADVNGDGRPDIVGLLAQQYETVVAYLNAGAPFSFEAKTIYTAPHPNWGSSGIQLIDMDGDKDLDVLMTHGDTFDDQLLKPYHGIIWLENTGVYPFAVRRLADLPGVLGARAGDVDGDGDLDVVACAFLAAGIDRGDERGVPSLVWLERTGPGEFRRHTLERRLPRHATLDLADAEGDGDLDIAVGNFLIEAGDLPWVELWENRRITTP